MTTALITHPACLLHELPQGHPERPARLKEVLSALEDAAFNALLRKAAPRADEDSLARVHSRDFIRDILDAIPQSGFAQLDSDTIASPGTGEAILRAAGALVLGVDLVMSGEAKNAFCAVRPPGHHATPTRAMGFCLFNNVAVGALHARAVHRLKRIAVVDFDVHHGNGTQDIFWADPTVMYCSTHQMPLFPGTGAKGERGEHDTIVNAPLAPDDGSAKFRAAFENVILPQLQKFSPELVIISAGFDAHFRDPLASLNLKAEDFGWVTRKLMDVADKSAGGRVVAMLEGGYDLVGLKESVAAHVAALMGT